MPNSMQFTFTIEFNRQPCVRRTWKSIPISQIIMQMSNATENKCNSIVFRTQSNGIRWPEGGRRKQTKNTKTYEMKSKKFSFLLKVFVRMSYITTTANRWWWTTTNFKQFFYYVFIQKCQTTFDYENALFTAFRCCRFCRCKHKHTHTHIISGMSINTYLATCAH